VTNQQKERCLHGCRLPNAPELGSDSSGTAAWMLWLMVLGELAKMVKSRLGRRQVMHSLLLVPVRSWVCTCADRGRNRIGPVVWGSVLVPTRGV